MYVESTLSQVDQGVSGYTSENLEEGRGLNVILDYVEKGAIAPGDAIVVEAIDRLGRSDFVTMLGVVIKLLQAGVSIVTLEDNKVYNEQSVNTPDAYTLVAKIQAAHEYSKRLGMRVSAAYEAKRVKARKGEDIRISVPFWLKSGGTVEPEAGDIVKHAIEMYLAGKGTRHIAKNLRGLHPSLVNLNPSTLKRWFSNKALIGTWKNKGDPIDNVFQSLIDEPTFASLQHELKRRTRTPSPAEKYILSGMVWCEECGTRFQTRRQKPKPTISAPLGSPAYLKKPPILYLNCRNYLQKAACDNSTTWPYEVLYFIYRRVAIDALVDVAVGLALDVRAKDLQALIVKKEDLVSLQESSEQLYTATRKQKHLDDVKAHQQKIDAIELEIKRLTESLEKQATLDAEEVEDSMPQFDNQMELQRERVQDEIEKLTKKPEDELAHLLKRYIKISIKRKQASTAYDEFAYELLSRSQKHACYLISSESPDTSMRFHAIGKGGNEIATADSLEKLKQKLEKGLDN